MLCTAAAVLTDVVVYYSVHCYRCCKAVVVDTGVVDVVDRHTYDTYGVIMHITY